MTTAPREIASEASCTAAPFLSFRASEKGEIYALEGVGLRNTDLEGLTV